MDEAFQSLYRLARAGDVDARVELLGLARRQDRPEELVLALLLAEPPLASWGEVVATLERVAPIERAELVERALPLAASWPKEARASPAPWVRRAAEREFVPELRLCARLLQQYTELGSERATVLASCEELENVRLLDLTHSRIDPPAARALLRSRHLRQIERLAFGRNRVGPDVVDALCEDPRWESLRELDLERSELDAGAIGRLARCEHLAGLRRLNLGHHRELGDEALLALAESPFLAQLEALLLSDTRVTQRGVKAMTQRRAFPRLAELRLDSTDVGDEGGRSLARAAYLQGLKTLTLNHCDMREAGVEAVLRAFPQLEALTIDALQPGPRAAEALCARGPSLKSLSQWRSAMNGADVASIASSPAVELLEVWALSEIAFAAGDFQRVFSSPRLQRLRHLQLHGCVLHPEGFANAELPALVRLDLGSSEVGAGVRDLFAASGLAGLKRLTLTGSDLRDGAREAFAGSVFGELEHLELTATQLEPGALETLAQSPAFANLRELHLIGARGLRTEDFQALARSPHMARLETLMAPQEAADEAARAEIAERVPRVRWV